MAATVNFRRDAIAQTAPKLTFKKLWGQGLAFITGLSVACVSPSVHAAETVILKYNETELPVPVSVIQALTTTGEVTSEALEEFLGIDARISNLLINSLDQEIVLDPDFQKQLANNVVGEFLVFQLNRLLSDPSQQNNLEPLQTALLSAYEDDNRFTLLEVIEEYPQPTILVDLTNLEQVYQEVNSFVGRVRPALDVLEDVLEALTLGIGQ